jgi:hypothetical protein
VNIFDILRPYGKRASLEDLGLYVLPQAVPPRNATLVDQSSSPIVPAGIPGVPGTALAFDYLVPANRRGIMARLAVDTPDPAALPAIRFAVLRSSAPVPNYQNVQAPIGTIGVPDTVNVVFDGDQHMQVVVSNSSAFDFEVHVRVVAWFWDVIMEFGR